MALLLAGVIIWSVTHLLPSVSPGIRNNLARKLGENGYRGLFSLVIIGALIMIVLGWKRAIPSGLYPPPGGPGPAISAIMLLAFILFFASRFAGNIKRFVRHPQMAGTLLWGTVHLLTNGDTRSVTLFGGLTLWAILEIVMCNRRDGKWQRPGPAAIKYDAYPIIIGSALFAAVLYFHGTLFGVPVIPA